MNGIIKNMKEKMLLIIIGYCTIVFIGCDPGARLIHSDSRAEEISINVGGIEILISAHSGGNIEIIPAFSIKSDTSIIIYADSMQIIFKDEILNYWIQKGSHSTKEKIFHLESGSIFIAYHKLLKLVVGDEITLYAKNYIQKGNEFFDIDSVTFKVVKEF